MAHTALSINQSINHFYFRATVSILTDAGNIHLNVGPQLVLNEQSSIIISNHLL